MSDLNLGPAQQSSPLKAVVVAFAVLAAIGAAVFYLNPHKTAELTITGTQLYTGHASFAADPNGVHVVGAAAHTEDDLYVVVTAKLTDKLRLPLFIDSIVGSYTMPDGSEVDAQAPMSDDLSRLGQSFPDLVPLLPHPLDDHIQVSPGATVEGQVLLHFPNLTETTWKARKSATLTINLAHQAPQTATIP